MPTTAPRLLALLSLLQTRRDWPAAVLADRLDVTDRTVRRDVDRLRELGYPITSTRGREGGYRLDAGTRLPPLLFDDEQAVALTVALRTAAASGADVGEAAERALRTVRQVLPARLAHRVDAVPVTVMTTARASTVEPAVLTALGAAVRAREVLRFGYAGAGAGGGPGSGASAADDDDDSPTRRVEPHHLVARGGRWYLVAWDLDRADWRVFRADRIRPRAPGGARFAPREVPGGDVAAFVAARFRGAEAGGDGDWPCRGTVLLAADAGDVAPFVAEGFVDDAGDGRCRVTLGSWSWVALAAAVARFDVEMLRVEPQELAEACARLADRFGRVAAETGPPGVPA
ncbi:helix-turn-helix transcriptional regulator [Cellulomonas pakistanensis]|uniref:DeoR family transcriptional regulator n=1 Tax=Cellulomonas pakistanensis TaxID=992287 RepID=A0A919PFD4_9CELL|nr:WYL domain-containing protein [Cellulomonas pakistanensis]GIG37157.1 DeoR family transcriptional regulator [Cellulomonas pakistanensis]